MDNPIQTSSDGQGEALSAEEVPAAGEPTSAGGATSAEEVPVSGEPTSAEGVPASGEPSSASEATSADEATSAEEVPASGEPTSAEEVPAAEATSAEEVPASGEPTSASEATSADEANSADDAPTKGGHAGAIRPQKPPPVLRGAVYPGRQTRKLLRRTLAGFVWFIRVLTVAMIIAIIADKWIALGASGATTSVPDSESVYMELAPHPEWANWRIVTAKVDMEPLASRGVFGWWPNTGGMRLILMAVATGQVPVKSGAPQIAVGNLQVYLPFSTGNYQTATRAQMTTFIDQYMSALGVTGGGIGAMDSTPVLMKNERIADHTLSVSPVAFLPNYDGTEKSLPVILLYMVQMDVPGAVTVRKGLASATMTLVWDPARARSHLSLSRSGGKDVLMGVACKCAFGDVAPGSALSYQGTELWWHLNPDDDIAFQFSTNNWVTTSMSVVYAAVLPALLSVMFEFILRRRNHDYAALTMG